MGISGGTYIVGAYGRGASDQGQVILLDGIGCGGPLFSAPSANREDENSTDAIATDEARVFPNPASEIVNIEIALVEAAELHVVVTDASGRTIEELFHGSAEEGTSMYYFDSAKVSNGMYFIRIESANLRKVVPVAVVK